MKSRLAALALISLVATTGCTAGAKGATDAGDDETLTVLAAASLTESFTELADLYEETHPDTQVRLAFDSSATLAEQAAAGAPADVLATADQETMSDALSAGALAAAPQDFAANTLVGITPADNSAGVTGLNDLAGVTFVVCVPTAPCGKVAAAILDDAGVSGQPASWEPDVKSVLAKVRADEADAGLVYATDAIAAGSDVDTFELPEADARLTTYPIAALAGSDQRELAAEFIDLVLSDDGRAVLGAAGFELPR